MRMAGVPVRVLIADDQGSEAAGAVATLERGNGFEVVGVAGSAAEASELARATQPDVALVYVHVAGGGDLAVHAILDAAPDARVLAHAGVPDHDAVIEMLHAGASGYVVRDAPAERLTSAVRAAVAGDTVFDDVVGRGVLGEMIEQVHAANRAQEVRLMRRA